MEYNQRTDKKPNNLISIHKEHENFFQDKMKYIAIRYGLTQEDERLWVKREVAEEKIKDNYLVKISGSMLQQAGSGLFLWRKLTVMSPKYTIEEVKFILKSILFELGLKYYIDEDGCGGLFSSKTSDEKQAFVYCYISPDFPEGYFENHMLEIKPIKPW
jgi:hypothetical protein